MGRHERGVNGFEAHHTHAHLEKIPDLEGALNRAQVAGVQRSFGVGRTRDRMRRSSGWPIAFPAFVLRRWAFTLAWIESTPKPTSVSSKRNFPLCGPGEVASISPSRLPGKGRKRFSVDSWPLPSGKRSRSFPCPEAWRRLGFAEVFPVERAIFHWYSGPPDVLQEIFARGIPDLGHPGAAYSARHRKRFWPRLGAGWCWKPTPRKV